MVSHIRSLPLIVATLTFTLLIGLVSVRLASADESTAAYYKSTLVERGIEPTKEGLSEYLKGLHPSDKTRATAAKLIAEMGNPDSFQSRESAMNKLLVMPTLPTEMLTEASQGKDPEIRWRALHILKIGRPESERVLFAAFQYVKETKLTGLASEVIQAIPLTDKRHIEFAARYALAEIAEPDDAQLLRTGLKSKNASVRVAAAGALGQALGMEAVADLKPLLNDDNTDVAIAAARSLANCGSRDAFDPLLAMLDSDDLNTRAAAVSILRQWTRQNFKYAGYANAADRKEAVAAWNTWAKENGKTAKLYFPLSTHSGATGDLAGHTLLAYGYQNKVAEVDSSGKEVWSFSDCQGAWSAEKLINGNVLIACNSQNRVIEVDKSGKIVWNYSCQNPLCAKPLSNGNFLIAEHNGGRALEVDREKNIVWEHKSRGNCSEAHRLDNGNTLIAAYSGAIIEVTPKGETVWEYPINSSYGARPLPNGNVLICDFNKGVIEVNRDKKIVWEMPESNAVDAFRLPNGNTLITGNSRFVEVTPDKKIVWQQTGCSYGSARR